MPEFIQRWLSDSTKLSVWRTGSIEFPVFTGPRFSEGEILVFHYGYGWKHKSHLSSSALPARPMEKQAGCRRSAAWLCAGEPHVLLCHRCENLRCHTGHPGSQHEVKTTFNFRASEQRAEKDVNALSGNSTTPST